MLIELTIAKNLNSEDEGYMISAETKQFESKSWNKVPFIFPGQSSATPAESANKALHNSPPPPNSKAIMNYVTAQSE